MSSAPSTPPPPNFVYSYLKMQNDIKRMKEIVKTRKQELNALKPQVSGWLLQVPKCEVALDIPEDKKTEFGDSGRLHFVMERRREHLGKGAIKTYLGEYLVQTIGAEKGNDFCAKLAEGACDHIWESRRVLSSQPALRRSVARKKQTNNKKQKQIN